MLDVLQADYFREYYATGFVETGMTLPVDLTERITAHFRAQDRARNDFPKFFEQNEHQAYLNGAVTGRLFGLFPGLARKMVERLYARTYERAVYGDLSFFAETLETLLAQGLGKFFKTRYLVASYDIFLGNDHARSGAGVHVDMPTFHHFYETENDITLYVPLVDLDETNGGRIMVLPESKLKIPGNVLLKLMSSHFGAKAGLLDADGYVDPDRITPEALKEFIASKPYQQFLVHYGNVMALANKRYAGEFETCGQGRGKVLLWNNKNFHAAEPWKNAQLERAVYIMRLFPVYDVNIKLRERLHGRPFNNLLIDVETASLIRHEGAVDLARIPRAHKLPLSFAALPSS